MSWWQRLTSRPAPVREGAAFHLWWLGLDPKVAVVEARATLEVRVLPQVERTYFWALQASFAERSGRTFGGAHTGLQWYARHPRSRAINWGGYASPPAGGVLAGTEPALPGFADDPNTRTYAWEPGRRYTFRIDRGVTGWRSSVSEEGGPWLALRELHAGGDRLTGFVVWSEVFARCDAPTTEVRWSDLVSVGADGLERRPDAVRCTFPNGRNCDNTDSVADDDGILQRTSVPRTAHDGMVVPMPRPGTLG